MNQRTREVIIARKTSHKHKNKRPESPTVTLTWHARKYKVHTFHQRYGLHSWIMNQTEMIRYSTIHQRYGLHSWIMNQTEMIRYSTICQSIELHGEIGSEILCDDRLILNQTKMLIYFTVHQSLEPRGHQIGNLVRQSAEYWIRLRYPCIPPVITLQHRTKWWSDRTFSEIIGFNTNHTLMIMYSTNRVITSTSQRTASHKDAAKRKKARTVWNRGQQKQHRAARWSDRKLSVTTYSWWSCTPP